MAAPYSKILNCPVPCNSCHKTHKMDEQRVSRSKKHDMACIACGSHDLDTSKVLALWPEYGFGKNNTFQCGEDKDA